MSISIIYKNGEYHWEMYDGPDGIDHFTGTAISLGDAMEQIIETRLRNRMRY